MCTRRIGFTISIVFRGAIVAVLMLTVAVRGTTGKPVVVVGRHVVC